MALNLLLAASPLAIYCLGLILHKAIVSRYCLDNDLQMQPSSPICASLLCVGCEAINACVNITVAQCRAPLFHHRGRITIFQPNPMMSIHIRAYQNYICSLNRGPSGAGGATLVPS